MLLATIVLVTQVGSAAPARSEPARPCADPSLLCRISPYFCPGTYPVGLEPCWPSDVRPTRSLPSRSSAGSADREGSATTNGGRSEREDVSRTAPRNERRVER